MTINDMMDELMDGVQSNYPQIYQNSTRVVDTFRAGLPKEEYNDLRNGMVLREIIHTHLDAYNTRFNAETKKSA